MIPKNYSEAQQALHGNSILTEEADSPTFKVCDYKGKISEQQTFKMRLEKTKSKSSNGIGFENGAYKMDNLGQYFNTFIKVQVLALNHQCNVRRLNFSQILKYLIRYAATQRKPRSKWLIIFKSTR